MNLRGSNLQKKKESFDFHWL